ncbi:MULTISPECIES: NADPH-dependent FMN reductase [Rhodovulum]|uniref:Chromate reductase n=2 Tax=Rhodovulum TaxID=34008 RepID=A0A8E3ARY6_9RHOB|nr:MULTISPECIES: NAD(P)H-dependent oxidoreductase [Rhodovulum]PTW51528.1 chromate reductase [Rhodovulum kholense]RAP43040.1 NADPH-dependent FMN reductase [Rhodovulum viride]
MSDHKLLGIAGALRKGSYNRMLLREAARIFDPAEFVEADLRLPLFDQDLQDEAGIPPEVQRLADQIAAADAVVIAGPEYNKSISGVLKNALDWVSRTEDNPWADKPVAIVSATGGRAGGERTQFALRLCLVPFRARVLAGPEVLVGQAPGQFDAGGRLTNEINLKALEALMQALKTEISPAVGH